MTVRSISWCSSGTITIIRETESNRDVAISEEIQATQPTEPPGTTHY